MRHIRNHTIVVTGTYKDFIDRAHAEASNAFGWVSSISPETVNGSRSFFVPPDGSKEGWDESNEGDSRRARFKAWLRSLEYEDGSSPLSWVEVYFGGDDMEAVVEDDGDASFRAANVESADGAR
jgi:hypothetical protein